MPDELSVRDAVRLQDTEESLIWGTDASGVGSAAGPITNEDMKVVRVSDGADVTATVTTGVMSVAGQIITWMEVHSLAVGEKYRIIIYFTKDGHDIVSKAYLYCPND